MLAANPCVAPGQMKTSLKIEVKFNEKCFLNQPLLKKRPQFLNIIMNKCNQAYTCFEL